MSFKIKFQTNQIHVLGHVLVPSKQCHNRPICVSASVLGQNIALIYISTQSDKINECTI